LICEISALKQPRDERDSHFEEVTIFFRQLFFFMISAKVFSILSGLSYVFRHPINGPYILAETRGGIAQEIHDAATAT
jgi:hypothetical protein